MSQITLTPYIFFTGNCHQAMDFYTSIFGGQLTTQTYDEIPGPTQAGMEGKIMHASLTGGAVALMASDTAKASPRAAKISLSLNGTDEEALRKMFTSLGVDGDIQSPLKKEFWGDTFGTLVDKFGVEWMVNIAEEKP